MDQNPADQTARQWLSRPSSGDEKDAEIGRLRERLAFYQSFESLIQDNIARSGDLLRQAMEMREGAASEIAAAQAEAVRQRAEDRSRYRIHFSAMLDELTALQGQAERLARRLTTALDEIELDLPTGAIALSLSEIDLTNEDLLKQTLALDAGSFALTAEPETETDVTSPEEEEPLAFVETDDHEVVVQPAAESVKIDAEPVLDAVVPEPVAAEPDTTDDLTTESAPTEPAPSEPEAPLAATQDESTPDDLAEDIPLDIQPFAPEDIVTSRHFAAGNDLALQPAVDPDFIPTDAPSTSTELAANSTIVLVHGVPRATTALSLKRYLEGLAHVGNVEPREFAEGILRLEVSGDRPLAFDDLRSWSEGETLEPVHLRDDLVEVRLSH
jgi:hypothetical protein